VTKELCSYATDEHESMMPFSYVMATRLLQKFDEQVKAGVLPWGRPDAKSQVTVEYEESPKGLKVLRVHTILMSVQHNPDVRLEDIQSQLKEHVINLVVPKEFLDENVKYVLNPIGSFIVGGPTGDSGLT